MATLITTFLFKAVFMLISMKFHLEKNKQKDLPSLFYYFYWVLPLRHLQILMGSDISFLTFSRWEEAGWKQCEHIGTCLRNINLGELWCMAEPGNQLFYWKERFSTCNSLSVIWVSRNGNKSCKKKRKDRLRTLRCVRSLNRTPAPSFSGSWKPGVLCFRKIYDPYSTHSISHKDKVHKGGEKEGLLQCLRCPKLPRAFYW